MIKELLDKKLKREIIVTKKDEIPFILFKVGNALLSVEMKDVFIVLEYKDIVDLPGAPPHILGIIYYQGEVIPIVDLKGELKESTTFRTDNTRLLIIKYNNEQIGLFVDEVLGLQNIYKNLLKESDEDIFRAQIKFDNKNYKVLDIDKFYNKFKVS